MTETTIFLYDEPSAKNKRLLDFLNANVLALKKSLKMNAIRINDKARKQLSKDISKLPAMRIGGAIVLGNNAIQEKLKEYIGRKQPISSDPLHDFQLKTIMQGDNEKQSDDNDLEKRFLAASQNRNIPAADQRPAKAPETIKSIGGAGSLNEGEFKSGSISSLVNPGDAMMRSFWENQEVTDI
jgi:hypothetical protein